MVTLINKNADNDSNVQLSFKTKFLKANFILLKSSSVSGKDVTLGGSAIDERGKLERSRNNQCGTT